MSVKTHRNSIVGLVGLVAGLSAGDALAGGFQLREQSTAALGNAYAGAAAAGEDASTIWYNPAAMTRLKGNQISGSTTLFMPVAKFSGTGMPFGNPSGDAITDAVGGATYAFWDYSPDVKFGVSLTSPLGIRSAYHNGWVGGLQALKSSVTNVELTPSFAWRVAPNFSIGGGVTLSYTDAELSQQTGWAGPGAAPHAVVEGRDYSAGFNVGALWEISPSTRVGATYRSQIANTLEGTFSLFSAGGPAYLIVPASAKFRVPAMASIGLVHDFDSKLSVKLGLDWTQWSSFKDLVISAPLIGLHSTTDEGWRDSWYASVGLDYRFVPGHTLRLGAAYDTTPVPDVKHRTARIPDEDRVWVTAGYSWDVNKNLRWDLGYGHLFVKDAKIDERNPGGAALPRLTGTYSGGVDLISTGFVYKF